MRTDASVGVFQSTATRDRSVNSSHRQLREKEGAATLQVVCPGPDGNGLAACRSDIYAIRSKSTRIGLIKNFCCTQSYLRLWRVPRCDS